MSEFWMGVLALPAIATAGAVVWLAYALAHYAWRKLHEAMFEHVIITWRIRSADDTAEDARNRSIDEFSDSLKRSRDGMWLLKILGFQVLITKSHEPEDKRVEVAG